MSIRLLKQCLSVQRFVDIGGAILRTSDISRERYVPIHEGLSKIANIKRGVTMNVTVGKKTPISTSGPSFATKRWGGLKIW